MFNVSLGFAAFTKAVRRLKESLMFNVIRLWQLK